MSKKKPDDGGQAFVGNGMGGMSLRDWFAGQALAGAVAYGGLSNGTPEDRAERAYQHADAMIAVRLAEKGG